MCSDFSTSSTYLSVVRSIVSKKVHSLCHPTTFLIRSMLSGDSFPLWCLMSQKSIKVDVTKKERKKKRTPVIISTLFWRVLWCTCYFSIYRKRSVNYSDCSSGTSYIMCRHHYPKREKSFRAIAQCILQKTMQPGGLLSLEFSITAYSGFYF